MKKSEFIELLQHKSIDTAKVKKIEERYNCHISDEFKRIVSICNDGYVFSDDEEGRFLSLAELLNAEGRLKVEFSEIGLIPVFHKHDNDYIAYRVDSQSWTMFNILDEIDYDNADCFDTLFLDENHETKRDNSEDLSVVNDEQEIAISNDKLYFKLDDGNIKVSGRITLGYLGTYADSQILIDESLQDIRRWSIIPNKLASSISDEQLVEFLNQYYNCYLDTVCNNINNINGTFLLQVITDMDACGLEFWNIKGLYLPDKNVFGDVKKIYNSVHAGIETYAVYLNEPNDDSIPKGHIETVLRSFYPMFDFDKFIGNIIPKTVKLCDGGLEFELSDNFGRMILGDAHVELDKNLCLTSWRNVNKQPTIKFISEPEPLLNRIDEVYERLKMKG